MAMASDIDRLEAQIRAEQSPADVVEALIRVVRDLPAVGKDEKMDGSSGGYKYRGIEAMTAAAQPLFGKHGVLVCPRVLESTTQAIEKGGKPWVHREMRVEYVLRGPHGERDFIVVGPFLAEADDNSDKSANKCMTQAFKQMLLQVLVMSDRKDDPDEDNRDRDAARPDPGTEQVGVDLAEPTYRKAEADGYTRAELNAVAAEVTGRAIELAGVQRNEWKALRDAWQKFREDNPRAKPVLPETAATPSGGQEPPAPDGSSTGDSAPEGGSVSGRAALGSKAKR